MAFITDIVRVVSYREHIPGGTVYSMTDSPGFSGTLLVLALKVTRPGDPPPPLTRAQREGAFPSVQNQILIVKLNTHSVQLAHLSQL